MSTILNDSRITIQNLIKNGWKNAAGSVRTKIAWPGDTIEPPREKDKGWIRPTIQFGTGIVATKNGRNTIAGTLICNIFMPKYRGDAEIYIKSDHFRDLFNRGESGNVRFGVPSGTALETRPEEGWRIGTISIPFTADEEI